MNRPWIIVAVTALTSLGTQAILSQTPPAAKEPSPPARAQLNSEPVNVLGGRLRLRLPADGIVFPESSGVAAAEMPVVESSEAFVQYGAQEMFLTVSETFSRAGSDFRAAVQKLVGAASKSVEPWMLAPPMEAVAYWPAGHSSDNERIPLMGLYAARADRTVTHVEFSLNSAAAQDTDGWENLARRIAATVTEGPRVLPSHAGDRRIAGYLATVPDGYVASAVVEPDLRVYYIRQLTAFGAPKAELGMLIASNLQTRPPGAEVKVVGTVLLGVKSEWYETVSADPSRPPYSRQAVVTLREGSPGVHAFLSLSSGTPAQMEELTGIAVSLRQEPPAAISPGSPH
jgi:hypothetical protein